MEIRKRQYHTCIDLLKAFAIILVVFYHALLELDLGYSTWGYACVTFAMRDVHVPLFILIAGYLCRRQDVKRFYLKKVRRLLIPFLFFTVLKLLVNNLFSTEYVHGDTLPGQLWDAFVCGQLYWFCYCLLIMFAVAPLLWDRKALQWVLLFVLLGANTWISAAQIPVTDILQLQGVVRYSPYFILGMLLSGYSFPGFRRKAGGVAACLAAALILGALSGYLRFWVLLNDSWYLCDFVFGLCVMYLLYLLAVLLERSRLFARVLDFPGKYSYQIMLLDPFWRMAGCALAALVLKPGLLMAVLITAFVLLCSCITCLIARHIPGLSFLMGIKRTGRQKRTVHRP